MESRKTSKAARDPERTGPGDRNPHRRRRCENNLSLKAAGGKQEPPGPRGACAPESATQGSE